MVLAVNNWNHTVMIPGEHLDHARTAGVFLGRYDRRDHYVGERRLIRGKDQLPQVYDADKGPVISIDDIDIGNAPRFAAGGADTSSTSATLASFGAET